MNILGLGTMSLSHRLLLLFALGLGIVTSQSVFALRCDGELVSEGDSMLSVLKKCGEPSWVDRWPEEIIDFPDTDIEHRVTRINERWVYNFGPTQFLRIITFRDGEVSRIESGGRGFTVVPGMQRCNFDIFSLGTTSAEVATQCGEPDVKAQHYETVTQKIPSGIRQITITVDQWTFNLGPTHFMRILTFRNGNLVEIRTGEKGFD